ncbi:hypothetical protein [Candidatus Nitrospira neomarina]|uniref:Uncharacterized protein n=1 Tax=Candidatus Nitrospira neomarina TaxID=3020899 RepID=A0AA96K1D2_9BACT|nr:hypothetical protein [Candidatus Nitrospira neomarina]WNM60569.1 hypothetical protein PQG83_12445 [Candidatus Nitrospira neomarina]
MKSAKKKGLALVGAVALVGAMASSAMAIEAFQERFEWGDLSKPTTLQGRVAVVDPYDKAVWVNVAVFGGNAESGYYWQKYFPGKNLKVYPANEEVWKTLVQAGKDSSSQAVMTDTKPSNYGLVEIVVQETEQNHRVVSSAKAVPEVAGTPDKPRSIHSLRALPVLEAIRADSWPNNRKMLYDVLIPDGQAIVGIIPYSDQGTGQIYDPAQGKFEKVEPYKVPASGGDKH